MKVQMRPKGSSTVAGKNGGNGGGLKESYQQSKEDKVIARAPLPEKVKALHKEKGPDGMSNDSRFGKWGWRTISAVWQRLLREAGFGKKSSKQLNEKTLAKASKALLEAYPTIIGYDSDGLPESYVSKLVDDLPLVGCSWGTVHEKSPRWKEKPSTVIPRWIQQVDKEGNFLYLHPTEGGKLVKNADPKDGIPARTGNFVFIVAVDDRSNSKPIEDRLYIEMGCCDQHIHSLRDIRGKTRTVQGGEVIKDLLQATPFGYAQQNIQRFLENLKKGQDETSYYETDRSRFGFKVGDTARVTKKNGKK